MGRIQRDRAGEGAEQRPTEYRVVMVPRDDQAEADQGADGPDRRIVADLGPRALAAEVGLLGDVVEVGGRLAGTVAPAAREDPLELEAPVVPLPSRQQAGEPAEYGLERGPFDRVGVERLPSGERASGDPSRDPALGEAMGRLIEGGGQATTGLGPLDLEDLLDSIHDGEFPGGGVEDRERSDREGGVDDVDPEGGRGSKTASGVTRTEVVDAPLADLSELGVPVRLPLGEVEMPADPVDLSEGRMSVSWGTYCKYKHLTLEPKVAERGSGRIGPHLSRIRPRIQAQERIPCVTPSQSVSNPSPIARRAGIRGAFQHRQAPPARR
jgi:hypothetical protein